MQFLKICFVQLFIVLLPNIFLRAQTSEKTVVAGAIVYDYQGLELGATGKLDQAREKFEEALRYNPYFARSILNQFICNDAIAGITDKKLAIDLFKALNTLASGNTTEALEIVDEVITKNTGYDHAYIIRGRIYQKEKQYDKADKDFSRAIEISSLFSLHYYFRGMLYAAISDYEKAIQDFTTSIDLKTTFAPVYLERGIAYSLTNGYDNAIQDFEIALDKWPKWKNNFKIFAAFLNRGMEKISNRQYEDAIPDLDKAITLNSNFGEPYLNRGIANVKLGFFKKAMADFNTAIQKEPRYAEAYYNRGLLHRQSDQLDAAVSDFHRTINLKPDYIHARYQLGEVYIKQKKYDSALTEFEQVIDLDPENSNAYYWKALVCDILKNYKKALDAYNLFLEKSPKNESHQRIYARERVNNISNWLSNQ